MPRRNKGPQVKKRKDTGKWGICEYKAGNRYWHVSGLETESEAEEELAILISEQTTEQQCRELDTISVGEIMAFYLENHVPHTATPERALSRHDVLTPFWAPLRASQGNKATCQRFCREMNEKRIEECGKAYSNDTLITYINHIEAAYNYAFDNEKITRVPKFWKPQKKAPVKEFYTRKEIALLRKEAKAGDASEYLPLFILLAVYTGVRKTAIMNLRWPNVDFENNEIDFTFAQTSRNKGYGVVAIPKKLRRELLKAKEKGLPMGYVLHINQKPIGDVKKSFKTAMKRAGLVGDMKKLRKTHGSWLKQKKVPTSFISKNLAHSSTLVTDRVYAHLDDQYKETIVNAF